MKTLVTGGAGFIGSHLVELLLQEGHSVVALDNFYSGRKCNLKAVENHPGFSLCEADIRERKQLDEAFEGIDWVFHLAGLADIVPSIENPSLYFDVNVQGTLNVLECAKEAKVKKIIYAASSSCYGIPKIYPTPEGAEVLPLYPYALTKYLGEQLVMHWERVYHLDTLSLRLFNVFGHRSRTTGTYGAVFGVFLAQKFHGKPFTVVGDGTQTRDFTYVTDVAKAFLYAARSNLTGEIFNVGSTGHYSINELVHLLKGEVVHIPKRPAEPDCTFADVSKIQKMLGWKAEVPFAKGVEKLLASLSDYQNAPLWDSETIETATASWFQCLKENEVACS